MSKTHELLNMHQDFKERGGYFMHFYRMTVAIMPTNLWRKAICEVSTAHCRTKDCYSGTLGEMLAVERWNEGQFILMFPDEINRAFRHT